MNDATAIAIDDLVLVSVDDHVVEPPGMFDAHVPERWRDRAPRVMHKDGPNGGFDVWSFDGRDVPNIALNAVAGRPPHRYGIDPTRFEDLRPGCYDVHARVMDMNANGVLGSMCFPSFPQFCGQLFARTEDKDLALVMLQAYNDWHIDEWCGAYPGRFIPLALPPIWDPQLMAAEVARVAAKGCHAITFSENPAKLGFPSWHDPHWDPFFAACSDHGIVICLHIGSSSDMVVTAMNAPVTVQMSLQPLNIVQCAADIIWSRVPTVFPDLRFALSEGGIGWVPYFLERCDFTYEHHRAWTGVDLGARTPTEVFRDHVITCFIDDPSGLEFREHIGVERITWECDYPHSDSTWPRSPEVLAPSLTGFSRAEIDAITHANAMRVFSFDPFSVRPREQSTVGALRAEAAGWDVSIRDLDRPWTPPERPITQDEKLAALSRVAERDRFERTHMTAAKYTAPAPQDWSDAQPHAAWAEARAQGAAIPAAGSSYDSRDAVVVTQFAAADAVVRDADTFSSVIHTQTAGVFKGETMRGMDGDEHRRHRALVATAFRPSAVERWRTAAIEPVIHQLIDAIEPLGRADLVADVTTRFPVQVICTIIGLPREDHQQFVEWSEAMNLGVLDPERGHAAADALTEYLRPIVDARRSDPVDDLISGLVHAEIDGERLSEDRIYSFLRLLVPAGAETTSRAMGNALVALLTHPDALDALTADRALLPAVVEECLRWETPVAMVMRIATRDTELGGCPIAAGTPVTVLTSSANHDERRWPDADEWQPGRAPQPNLAFGAGPHACLGVNLARAELHLGIGALLDRLPGLALDPDDVEPVVAGYAFRGPHRLPVVFGA